MANLKQWHAVFPGGVKWRITKEGVEIQGQGVVRTPGPPNTITRLWRAYHYHLLSVSSFYGVPVELILATIATEAGPRLRDLRKEPGYISDEQTPHRISVGIMHTLISTARSALKGEMSDAKSIVNRAWLKQPGNSIRAGAAYIHSQQGKTRFDPPVVAAAYNSGGVYHQRGANNRWKLRQYPIGTGKHVDRFVAWYNDAVAVVSGDRSLQKPVTHESYWFKSTGPAIPRMALDAARKKERWRILPPRRS